MADSGWTVDTLKEHFDSLRETDQKALDAAFEAAKEKSASHNDLIAALERVQTTFVTKGQVAWAITALIGGLGVATTLFIAFGR